GYEVRFQGPPGEYSARASRLDVPATNRVASSGAVEISFERILPLPSVADFDGNGLKDIFLISDRRLLVFLQEEKGVLRAEPSLTLKADLHRSQEGAGRVVNVALWVCDVNADSRADVVSFVAEGSLAELENMTSSALLFLNRGRDGFPDTPNSIINLKGMLVGSWVGDFNGDGCADLLMTSVKTDFTTAMMKYVSKQTQVDYAIHLFDKRAGGFTVSPGYLGQERIAAEDGSLWKLLAQFNGDVDGDRISDRVGLREKDGKTLLYARHGKRGSKPNTMAFDKKPMFEREVEKGGMLRVLDIDSDGRAELVYQTGSALNVFVVKR
ncbi:MAG: VCBS repeat-containing protein, partial [Planctomycetota bacterium]|nr:VCBS repeat-containing protein [Planctomycetota bacterium]